MFQRLKARMRTLFKGDKRSDDLVERVAGYVPDEEKKKRDRQEAEERQLEKEIRLRMLEIQVGLADRTKRHE